MSDELKTCPECRNEHLAIRTDIYKDGREFVYCDCCGCLASKGVWNLIVRTTQPAPIPVQALVEIRRALQEANEKPNGPICDTIWMPGRPETLFDFIDEAIAAIAAKEG